ncbi:MAG: leucyl aminopeptidase [Candidatus Zixiibacteriota bacterium]|nr:MAG: leucyl aminopeptidase [candidate division Zixibacteria bacterium]
MNLKYSSEDTKQYGGPTVVLFVTRFEKLTDNKLKELDELSLGALTTLLKSKEFTGKDGELATLYRPGEYRADRIVLAGLGDARKLNADSYRRAAGNVSRHKSLASSGKAAFYLGKSQKEEFYQAAIEGYILGSFKLLKFKTDKESKDQKILDEITFLFDNRRLLPRLKKAVERGVVFAECQNLVRTLASTPSNHLTPRLLANQAQKLAKVHGFTCKILDEKAVAREKMGAFLAVARGAKEPPRFIVLEYKGTRAARKPVVLVGKGITFDTGGISLKPGLNMHEMKSDMTGAAVVLAAVVAAARLKIPQNVIGLMPATENMPSATATKPGDIVTSRKGLTVEIINTDAEGRLILADALDYANVFKPQAVVDIATLTGAALIVLGYAGAPILGNSPKLLKRVKDSAERTAEKVWEMPIWDEHRENMKSTIADVVNSYGRPGGTITAAAFLENFIGDYPWVHVDIASVDVERSGKPYTPKGLTGTGLRLLADILYNWKAL